MPQCILYSRLTRVDSLAVHWFVRLSRLLLLSVSLCVGVSLRSRLPVTALLTQQEVGGSSF